MNARVRIAPRQGAGFVVADLVDVSAGGLRARLEPPPRHATGSCVEVEIRLGPPEGDAGAAADVSLRGRAIIVRLEQGHGADRFDAALRFTGPLEMRNPFDKLLVF